MGFGFVLFDFTDKTTMGHFFALWYRMFFSKKMVLVPLIWLPTPCASRPSSNLFFVAPYEVAVLLGLTGDGESDGVCLRDCNIICRVGVLC